jgi:hypothetical protein
VTLAIFYPGKGKTVEMTEGPLLPYVRAEEGMDREKVEDFYGSEFILSETAMVAICHVKTIECTL